MAKGKKRNDAFRDVEPGVYILVDDGSDEFDATLIFAARVAKADDARLGLVHIMDTHKDFMHWRGLASRMDNEIRDGAEQRLWMAAQKVNEISGEFPVLFLEEGNPKDVIPRLTEEFPEIKRLVLGAKTGTSNPGPLVKYFTGKGISSLKIPMTIVPDNVDIEDLLSRMPVSS